MNAPRPTDLLSADAATADHAAGLIERLRAARPRVHVLTNPVAQAFTANMLLALGAEPAMTAAPDEIADFVVRSGALLVNLGMLDQARREASEAAIDAARGAGVPWVLDPVKAELSPRRKAFAEALAARRPAVVKVNRGELEGLAGASDASAAGAYAARLGAVVAVSGPVDHVTDGRRAVAIANGHPLMDRVTAMGCAAGAVVAAFTAVEPDAYLAAAAGLILFGIAGEIAAARAAGPGSLVPALLDAVYALDRPTILAKARLS
jgi:hydroxyethylthiazole kinase